jgi:predicted Zn-dependent protease with MMP-like domain
VWLSFEAFERLVVKALDALPEPILSHLENVDIVIDDWPTHEQLDEAEMDGEGTLLGLYEGVPHIDRTSAYGMVLPDKITIFRGPILDESENADDVETVVRDTVIHEVAHHFGISDERLIELDRY